MCSARHAEDKTGSDKLSWEQALSLEPTDTCIVHKQTNKDCASRNNNSDRSATSGVKHKHGEKQQRRRDASASGKEKPRQRGQIDKLDYTSRFLRVIPTFSQHCRNTVAKLYGSRVVCVNMVVKGCLSQHLHTLGATSESSGSPSFTEMERCQHSSTLQQPQHNRNRSQQRSSYKTSAPGGDPENNLSRTFSFLFFLCSCRHIHANS